MIQLRILHLMKQKYLMNHFNFKLTNKGRSSGSRVQFNVAMLKLIYTNHTLEILLKHIK